MACPGCQIPPPAQVFAVFGVEYDSRPFPHRQIIIRITERRFQVLSTTLNENLESGRRVLGASSSDMGNCNMNRICDGARLEMPNCVLSPVTDENKNNTERSTWLRVLPVGATPLQDIYEIEALGPLVVLATLPG